MKHSTIVTRNDILTIMEALPTLGSGGFSNRPPDSRQFLDHRESLMASAPACSRVAEWLAGVEKTETINRQHNCNDLKRYVERRDCKGVSIGAFVVGCLHMGFRYEIDGNNIFFNVSERSLARLELAICG